MHSNSLDKTIITDLRKFFPSHLYFKYQYSKYKYNIYINQSYHFCIKFATVTLKFWKYSSFRRKTSFHERNIPFSLVTGCFGPIPVQTPGRFGPNPFWSGRFGVGCFAPILKVGHFGPILVGCFGPFHLI